MLTGRTCVCLNYPSARPLTLPSRSSWSMAKNTWFRVKRQQARNNFSTEQDLRSSKVRRMAASTSITLRHAGRLFPQVNVFRLHDRHAPSAVIVDAVLKQCPYQADCTQYSSPLMHIAPEDIHRRSGYAQDARYKKSLSDYLCAVVPTHAGLMKVSLR